MELTESLRNRRLELQKARQEIDTGLEKKTVTDSYLAFCNSSRLFRSASVSSIFIYRKMANSTPNIPQTLLTTGF